LSHVKSEFRSLSSRYERFPCTCTMMQRVRNLVSFVPSFGFPVMHFDA